jgi:glycosyltransferase involved in cell wall biosynthesis
VLRRILAIAILRRAEAIVLITPDEGSILSRWGVVPRHLALIPNGAERAEAIPDPEGFRRRQGLEAAPFILYLGRFAAIKGPDLLVEAFGRVRDHMEGMNLVVAGPDYGIGPQVWAAAAALGGRIQVRGPLWGEEKDAALAAAEFVVIPSRMDAMTHVGLEAAAWARPVLATRTAHFPDVEEADGGLLVPPTVEGLADGLRAMMARRSQWPEMGARLRAHCAARYSPDTLGDRYARLFAAVLDGDRLAVG